MFTRALQAAALLALLLMLAESTSAQPIAPERPVSATPEQQTVGPWPQIPADGTQTSFSIRHDAADGTIVGMSLQQSRFPSLLLQLEVVPPGYGPAVESDQEHSPAAPNVDKNLRTVHKLSLRYRF